MPGCGYVLVGGRSARMGSDKALLPYQDRTLVEHLAATLATVASTVRLVGPPHRYTHLTWPVIPDLRPGQGPLAGIEAALLDSSSPWTLILSCDLVGVTPELLQGLLDCAAQPESHPGVQYVLAARTGFHQPDDSSLSHGGHFPGEPLCAAYHRSILPVISHALNQGRNKVREVLSTIPGRVMPLPLSVRLFNVNTPADWELSRSSLPSPLAEPPHAG
jgi:molybdenum cofactor guanylyltransferase